MPQQQAPFPPLPMETDPNGFLERAPALSSLLPDEALSRALAGGDAFAVHAALAARYAREPKGPTRDTLREVLAQRALFAVSEAPPRLGGALGTGFALAGLPPVDQQAEPFIATRCVRLLGMPLWPSSQHLVRRGRDGQLHVLGRVPTSLGFSALRWLSRAAAGLVVLTGVSVALSPFLMRELFIVNGLSRPVQVYVDGKPVALAAGRMTQEWKLSLGSPYRVSAMWEGEQKPFEERSVEASQRAVYNVLGAASMSVDSSAANVVRMRPLEGAVASLQSDEHLMVNPGGWEPHVHEQAEQGRVREAVSLAMDIAMADPLAARAREVAALYMMRLKPEEAEEFVWKLHHRYPGDTSVSHLVQDVLVTLRREDELRRVFSEPRYREATSAPAALLYARSRPPEQLREAYDEVLERFPEAPEAQRAVARVRMADGYPQRALELLEAARAKAPESLEDLELRVRALVALKEVAQASSAVREYGEDPSRRSWQLGVLAARLARIAGPTRTQYVLTDVMPSENLISWEDRMTFALLSGEREEKQPDLLYATDPARRQAQELARTLLTDLDTTMDRALETKEGVFRHMPVEVAVVLALELQVRGQQDAADRVFRSHFALMHAREPLERYVLQGQVHPRFPMLAPDLLAAAYLVRGRAIERDGFLERAFARWTENLGGYARRALDPDHREPEPREVRPVSGPQPALSREGSRQVIHTGGSQPEQLGPRVPRPW